MALKGQESVATTQTVDPHLSKRQKWRLKWKARRLKRKAEATPTDHTPSTTPEPIEVVSHSSFDKGKRQQRKRKGSLRTDAMVTRNSMMAPPKQSGKTKRASVPEGQPLSKRARKQAICHDTSDQSKGKDRSKGSRKYRSKHVSEVEEANFENMVNKYRQKLEKTSFSKWVK